MSIQDRMRRLATPYLEPGETIDAVFGAGGQTIKVVVVATNQRIVVFNASQQMLVNIKGIRNELPRNTTFGKPHGALYPVPMIDPNYVVGHHYYKDIIAADAALAARKGHAGA
jgi:hypothetical protein